MKKFSPKYKAKLVLEHWTGKSIQELSDEYDVHTSVIMYWVEQAKNGLPGIFKELTVYEGGDNKNSKVLIAYARGYKEGCKNK